MSLISITTNRPATLVKISDYHEICSNKFTQQNFLESYHRFQLSTKTKNMIHVFSETETLIHSCQSPTELKVIREALINIHGYIGALFEQEREHPKVLESFRLTLIKLQGNEDSDKVLKISALSKECLRIIEVTQEKIITQRTVIQKMNPQRNSYMAKNAKILLEHYKYQTNKTKEILKLLSLVENEEFQRNSSDFLLEAAILNEITTEKIEYLKQIFDSFLVKNGWGVMGSEDQITLIEASLLTHPHLAGSFAYQIDRLVLDIESYTSEQQLFLINISAITDYLYSIPLRNIG